MSFLNFYISTCSKQKCFNNSNLGGLLNCALKFSIYLNIVKGRYFLLLILCFRQNYNFIVVLQNYHLAFIKNIIIGIIVSWNNGNMRQIREFRSFLSCFRLPQTQQVYLSLSYNSYSMIFNFRKTVPHYLCSVLGN